MEGVCMTEDYVHINKLACEDVERLIYKGKTYGDSWRKRGGVGAFMMLARKWDRIENAAQAHDWNIFKAISAGPNGVDGVIEDIQDLRAYLLLVESYMTEPKCGEPVPQAVPPHEWEMLKNDALHVQCRACGAKEGHGSLPCPFMNPTSER
jgi:hypothetical protein